MNPQLVAVDWGTTNFRAWLLGPGGVILDACTRAAGIRQVDGRFPDALDEAIGPWRAAAPRLPVLMAGMIGSRQGWHEVPYVACPATTAALAAGVHPVPDAAGLFIVPGVCWKPADTAPDVMRGEETQIAGLGSATPFTGLVVMPGTHSKWVTVRDGVISQFSTYMTGELFALLRQHSILGAMMKDGDSEAAFMQGLAAGFAHGGHGYVRSLFGVRTKGLFGDLAEVEAGEYLSGLLIAGEINEALHAAGPAIKTGGAITIVGAGPLALRYEKALIQRGFTAEKAPEEVSARGLWRIAEASGMVPSHD